MPISCLFTGALVALALAQSPTTATPERIPTLTRLGRPYLEQVHAEIAALAAKRKPVTLKTGRKDWRCILHCHSYLSHDSRGQIQEIAAAAKQVGVHAIFVSDHPKKDVDVVAAGKRGIVNSVLFVPGSETNGFLLYPGDGKLPPLNVDEQTLTNSLQPTGGMIFVAHPEEHTNWSLTGLTGMEIYNTHADFKDETELLNVLQPKNAPGYARLLSLLNTMRDYPREAFAALFDAPTANLAHYDALCKTRVLAAVAGNDSHQNTGFVVFGTEDGKYRLESALGEPLATLDPVKTPILKQLFGEPQPGKELYRRILDPYPASLGYVSTHILAPECTEAALRKALHAGRTYVAFDWIADPTGTAFTLQVGAKIYTLGDTVPATSGEMMTLRAETPLPGTLRLLRNGKEVTRQEGRTLSYQVGQPGVYRLEVSVPLGGEQRPWLYTGAIRITPNALAPGKRCSNPSPGPSPKRRGGRIGRFCLPSRHGRGGGVGFSTPGKEE